ncbi:MAG TPA: Maf family nucleotide pyrophosphatase [Xanthobacteraceae bacterium]|nr:Maf family nucleotide pyrophosphatase [Xanthobacteraceae bacterium]
MSERRSAYTWLPETPLVLASRSRIRQTLLVAAGIPVDIYPADIDERALESRAAQQSPGHVAALLAREKASVIARAHPHRFVLGADQVLALGDERLSKPADRTAARAQLAKLRGRTHELHSAIAFVEDATVIFEHVSVARLTMRTFTDRFLDEYLEAAGDDVCLSIGAYQLEGLGVQLFERVEGDYFTVLGLPLLEALAFLRRHGCLAS